MLARVKKDNNYGGAHTAGAVVDVDPEELARVPWCLEALTEEECEAEAARLAPPPPMAVTGAPVLSEDKAADDHGEKQQADDDSHSPSKE